MPEYLDVGNWARRDLFEFFRTYANPYFNICTRLDITEASAHIRSQPSISISLALHYVALRAANETEPFKYRLEDGKVVIYESVHGGTIVLQPNESFNFAYFDYVEDFGSFIQGAQRSVDEASRVNRPLQPDPSENRLHFTVLPWLAFTSFAHARNLGREESIPKIAFGKFIKENERVLVPFSVEVHHALMDGLHVGRYVTRVQELLDTPETTFMMDS
ncbi:MAG TPA: CatA-like O-acetyltransferase [Pyrinomonadaceae bacterium]